MNKFKLFLRNIRKYRIIQHVEIHERSGFRVERRSLILRRWQKIWYRSSRGTLVEVDFGGREYAELFLNRYKKGQE